MSCACRHRGVKKIDTPVVAPKAAYSFPSLIIGDFWLERILNTLMTAAQMRGRRGRRFFMRSLMPLAVGIAVGLVSISGHVVASGQAEYLENDKLRFVEQGSLVDFASDVVFKEKQAVVSFSSRDRETVCTFTASPSRKKRILAPMRVTSVSASSELYVDQKSRRPVYKSEISMMLSSSDPDALIPAAELKCRNKHFGAVGGNDDILNPELTLGNLREAVSSAISIERPSSAWKTAMIVRPQPKNLSGRADKPASASENSKTLMTITVQACEGTDLNLCM